MNAIIRLYTAVMANLGDITQIVAYVCLAASAIVKLTPTLKDDAYLKPVIKFLGKYLALDKYGPTPPSA